MAAEMNTENAQADYPELIGDDHYTSYLGSRLYELREQGSFCDVTITVENQQFPAHKVVLSASSTYFDSMFNSGFQEREKSQVKIQEGTAESFTQLLRFAYTGFFRLSLTNIVGILSMACFFGFTQAIDVCTKYIKKYFHKLSLEDAFAILTVGDSQIDLREIFYSHLLPNFVKFAGTKCFVESVSQEFLLKCLTAGEIETDTDTTTEEEILQSTLTWLRHDWNHRKAHTFALLKKIRLGLVPADRLKQMLGDDILAIPECQEMVQEVIMLHATKESAKVPLVQSHPDLFANRNTITALVFVSQNKGVQYFDEQSLCGNKPSYTWKKLQNLPVPDNFQNIEHEEEEVLYTHVLVTASRNLYACGLPDNQGAYRGFARYNANSKEWEDLAYVIHASDHRFEQDCALIESDGYMYAICASSVWEFYPASVQVSKYNISEDHWVVCPQLPEGLVNSPESVVVFNKKLLILNSQNDATHDGFFLSIILYDPEDDTSLEVLKPTHIDSLHLHGRILFVHNEASYLVTKTTLSNFILFDTDSSDDYENTTCRLYPKVPPKVESNPRVFRLNCKLNEDPPSVEIGEEIPQTHPYQGNHIGAFCIDGKSFVNVNGFVHKIKDDVVDENDLVQWRCIRQIHITPVLYTFDMRL